MFLMRMAIPRGNVKAPIAPMIGKIGLRLIATV
jgi:hypothetical protein